MAPCLGTCPDPNCSVYPSICICAGCQKLDQLSNIGFTGRVCYCLLAFFHPTGQRASFITIRDIEMAALWSWQIHLPLACRCFTSDLAFSSLVWRGLYECVESMAWHSAHSIGARI